MTHDDLLARIAKPFEFIAPSKALRAVVELHKPVTEKHGLVLCNANCEDEYPCKTIRVIEGELK